jgi:hypothetical protein
MFAVSITGGVACAPCHGNALQEVQLCHGQHYQLAFWYRAGVHHLCWFNRKGNECYTLDGCTWTKDTPQIPKPTPDKYVLMEAKREMLRALALIVIVFCQLGVIV